MIANWPTATLSHASVTASAKKVNANFASQMRSRGVDPTKANVFADAFAANHTGLDAVLDSMRVGYGCTAVTCTFTITDAAGTTALPWNNAVPTTGINLSWAAPGTTAALLNACSATAAAGTYSMVVQASITGAAPTPAICYDGLTEKPGSQSEFCDAEFTDALAGNGVQVLSCSFADSVGRLVARKTTPPVADMAITITFLKR